MAVRHKVFIHFGGADFALAVLPSYVISPGPEKESERLNGSRLAIIRYNRRRMPNPAIFRCGWTMSLKLVEPVPKGLDRASTDAGRHGLMLAVERL